MMHKIGDKVFYGSNGILTVVDIREESVGDFQCSYYVLREIGAHSESLTFVPMDNEKLVAQLRPLLTREEIFDVIHAAKHADDCEWAKDSRARTDLFRKIMDSGDRVRILTMIRTIYNEGINREKIGKKNYISDDNAMRKAEKLLCCEFSIVLGIPEDEVIEFVKAEMEKS